MNLDVIFSNLNFIQLVCLIFGVVLIIFLIFVLILPKQSKPAPNSSQYKAYLSLLQLITDLSLVLINKKENIIALPEKLLKTKQELILYGSPKIIEMFNNYIANIGISKETVSPYNYFQNMNRLIKEIRKEVGVDSKNLSNLEYIEFLTGVNLKTLKSYLK